MSLLNKIMDVVGGNPHADTAQAAGAPQDVNPGPDTATTEVADDVSTPANNAVLDDVGSYGVQAASKPTEIERAQRPNAVPGDNDLTRP